MWVKHTVCHNIHAKMEVELSANRGFARSNQTAECRNSQRFVTIKTHNVWIPEQNCNGQSSASSAYLEAETGS